MPGVIRFQQDVGLLSNKRMALEIAVGLAHLTGRRLSMPFEKKIGPSPVSSIPADRAGEDARVLDLLEVPVPIVHPDEWDDEFLGSASEMHDWEVVAHGVVVAGPEIPVDDPVFTDFLNGRTKIWAVPHSDARVVDISGRLLSFYSYFFYATGPERRGLHALLRGVRPRRPYRELGSEIASDLGRYNAAHIRRSDLTKGIKAYADVTPAMIADNLAALLPTDEPLLVCSEVDGSDELFDPLRVHFPDLVFANDLILHDHGEAFYELPHHEDNALGVVTQLVGARANAFVGTMGSTFSAMIQRERILHDPNARFMFTADFSPPGPMFRDGEFQEVRDGSFSWNRIGLKMSPDVLAWFREWPEVA